MNKRIYERFHVELPVRYKGVDPSVFFYTATVMDVGPEGLCFLSKHPFGIGEEIELNVNLGEQEEVLLKTEVIWVRKFDNAGCKVGVKITDTTINDEIKFMRFYCQEILSLSESYKKILIIDDEKDMVELLQMELEQERYQ